MNTPIVTAIFPAYNECKTIEKTVAQAVDYFRRKSIDYEVIVSADGTDGTREVVREMGKSDPRITAIGQDDRGGKGLGIRKAVTVARGKYIGFADADNKTPFSEFDKFYPLLESGVPIVIGSRALKESQIEAKPLLRRIGSFGFRYCMQWITGLHGIPDTQCGFKFFQHDVAKKLFSLQTIDSYMFDVEILVLAKRLGYTVEQVPVRWQDDGDTRLNFIRGNIKNLRDLIRVRQTLEK